MTNQDQTPAEAKQEPVQLAKNKPKPPSDFVIGLVTFIVFIVFMTLWMYFGVTDEVGR